MCRTQRDKPNTNIQYTAPGYTQWTIDYHAVKASEVDIYDWKNPNQDPFATIVPSMYWHAYHQAGCKTSKSMTICWIIHRQKKNHIKPLKHTTINKKKPATMLNTVYFIRVAISATMMPKKRLWYIWGYILDHITQNVSTNVCILGCGMISHQI